MEGLRPPPRRRLLRLWPLWVALGLLLVLAVARLPGRPLLALSDLPTGAREQLLWPHGLRPEWRRLEYEEVLRLRTGGVEDPAIVRHRLENLGAGMVRRHSEYADASGAVGMEQNALLHANHLRLVADVRTISSPLDLALPRRGWRRERAGNLKVSLPAESPEDAGWAMRVSMELLLEPWPEEGDRPVERVLREVKCERLEATRQARFPIRCEIRDSNGVRIGSAFTYLREAGIFLPLGALERGREGEKDFASEIRNLVLDGVPLQP